MNPYDFLFDLALILLSTKVLGLFTRKIHMPQVVGALLAGLLLGPAVLNILKETELIHDLSEIGVIVLMFCAGMETDMEELKKSGIIYCILGDWLYLNHLMVGHTYSFCFPFIEEDKEYIFKNHHLTFRWKGDSIIAASSEGKRLCFFQELS